jgi:hypothetical protein
VRRIGTRGAVALLLALPPIAAGAETAAADAGGIIDRYVDAIGGDARNRGIVSLGAVGRFEMPERKLSGIVELYAKAPDKAGIILRRTDGTPFLIQAFDGTVAWERALRQDRGAMTLRRMSGGELAQLRLDSDFYWNVDLKRLYPVLTVKSRGKLEDRDADIVEAMPRTGRGEVLFFDAASGLLHRRDVRQSTASGETPARIYFDDYASPAAGVDYKIAYTRSYFYPDRANNIIFRFTQIRLNIQLADATFSPPRR